MNENSYLPYTSLCPIDNADNGEIYSEALEWALAQDDIRNIALTGAYGSGKSSIIKTFFDNTYKDHYKYINVSLASFDNDKHNEQLIEKSILQQLFYNVPASEIPLSRFKRIEEPSKDEILKYVVLVIVLLDIIIVVNSGTNFAALLEYLNQMNNGSISNTVFIVIVILALFFICLAFNFILAYLLYKICYYLIGNLKINRIIFKNNYMEIESNSEESVINKYIDEIIYFFKKTKYEVVVFEDLDRFTNNTKVFTELRELNQLINLAMNENKHKHKYVTFIYAVKESIFDENMDKTKFFDFIIPVIAVNSQANMSNAIIEMLKSYGFETKVNFDSNYLNDMSYYISDRRFLINIMNEFYIYMKTFSTIELEDLHKKIFSLIVYKNNKPKEFDDLIHNKGIIYTIFINKEKVSDDDEEQSSLNDSAYTSMAEYSRKHENIYEEFQQSKALMDFLNSIPVKDNDDNKSKLSSPKKLNEGKLEDINESDTNDVHNNKLNGLTNDMVVNYLNSPELKKLFPDKDYTMEKEFIEKGYIDESYVFYLSYSGEGILSNNDREFYLYVKNKDEVNGKYATSMLNNMKYLVKMFNKEDFSTIRICNYSLLKYLIKMRGLYKVQIEDMVITMSQSSDSDFNQICKIVLKELKKDTDDFKCIIDIVDKEYKNDHRFDKLRRFLNDLDK